jgi:adenosylmethionine---8-amino-7-oxononanoate aminotransferase
MKIAQQYAINRGEPRRTRFVSFKGGYHGDTVGAMSVTDPGVMHDLFSDALPEQLIVGLPDSADSISALETVVREHGERIAGVIVEPLVQGAGGMRFHDAAVLKQIDTMAKACGALLIFDEIFTGFGRTGTMFACEQAAVAPDIITLSKALSGGTLPLAATVARKHVFDTFWSDDSKKALMHGPTYMGNPLACAAANASLDLFESEPRLEQVADIGRQMIDELAPCRGLPGVKDVRVKGAIGVVEMERIADLAALRARFIDEGVYIRPFGTIIYLTPSFTIAPDELSRLTSAIAKLVGQGSGI